VQNWFIYRGDFDPSVIVAPRTASKAERGANEEEGMILKPSNLSRSLQNILAVLPFIFLLK
jgi:hypothetical protein